MYRLKNCFAADETNTSRIINRGECLLSSILITADGADGEVDIYDGLSDNDEHKIKLLSPDTYSRNFNFSQPVHFRRGLYVKVNAATTYCTVSFLPTEPYVEG